MQLRIYASGLTLPNAFGRRLKEKLDLALDRLEREVVGINVFLMGGNPTLSGQESLCRIVVLMRQQDVLVVEGSAGSVEAGVDRATDHLGVAACQRADMSKRRRKLHQRFVDSEDALEFQWSPSVR